MSNEKQTALYWFTSQIEVFLTDEQKTKILPVYIKAKSIEKQHIVEAYVEGCKDTYGQKEPLKSFSDEHVAECYYSQKYNQ